MRTASLALLLPALLALSACGDAATDEAPASDSTATETAVTDAAATDTTAAGIVPLNLNTASEEEFLTVPNVGERMAHEFEEYRPYTSITQFRREIGKYVDEAQVAAYEPYVFVPINPETSDAETLQQLPGVGAAEAERLINGRPYASPEAFLTAYSAAVPTGDREAAARLLDAE